MFNINENSLAKSNKKFDAKYLLIFIVLYFIELFSTTIVAVITGYNSTLEKQNPEYLLTIIWFVSKVIPLIVVLFIYFKRFKDLAVSTAKNFKKFILYSIAAYFVFYIFEIGEVFYQELIGGMEADNQTSIYALFGSSNSSINYVLLFITIVILAPLLEEFEYRELVFKMFEGCHFIVPALISATLFSLAHVEDFSSLDALLNGLKFFPIYFLPGFALSLIYYYSGKNFYSTYLVHAAANCISYITIVQQIEQGLLETSQL